MIQKAEEVVKISLDTVRQFNIRQGDKDEERKPLGMTWFDQALKNHLLVADSLGDVSIYDTINNKLVVKERIGSSWLYSIDADPYKGQVLAAGSLNSKIHVMKNNLVKDGKVIFLEFFLEFFF